MNPFINRDNFRKNEKMLGVQEKYWVQKGISENSIYNIFPISIGLSWDPLNPSSYNMWIRR